jgi:hypothetical protein
VDLASGGGSGAEAIEVTTEGTESLVEATMVSVEAAGAFVEDPFPDVLGGDSRLMCQRSPPTVVNL